MACCCNISSHLFLLSSNNLMVTAGATQGLHLISTVLFDVNTPVFVEDPTYFIAITMLQQDLGMNIISGE